MKNKVEKNQNIKQLNILPIIIRFLKILMNILGLIVGIVSLPFLFMGVVGMVLFCPLKYFGIPIDSDDDVYLSGPFRGNLKN